MSDSDIDVEIEIDVGNEHVNLEIEISSDTSDALSVSSISELSFGSDQDHHDFDVMSEEGFSGGEESDTDSDLEVIQNGNQLNGPGYPNSLIILRAYFQIHHWDHIEIGWNCLVAAHYCYYTSGGIRFTLFSSFCVTHFRWVFLSTEIPTEFSERWMSYQPMILTDRYLYICWRIFNQTVPMYWY
jgi:hypothetical protein